MKMRYNAGKNVNKRGAEFLKLISLASCTLIGSQSPFYVCLCLLDRPLTNLVCCCVCQFHFLYRRGTGHTSHLESGTDFGELYFFMRCLDEDVVTVHQENFSCHQVTEKNGTHRNEMKSPSLTNASVRLLSSLSLRLL